MIAAAIVLLATLTLAIGGEALAQTMRGDGGLEGAGALTHSF